MVHPPNQGERKIVPQEKVFLARPEDPEEWGPRELCKKNPEAAPNFLHQG